MRVALPKNIIQPAGIVLATLTLTKDLLLTVDFDFDFNFVKALLSSIPDAYPKRFTNSRGSTWEANTR